MIFSYNFKRNFNFHPIFSLLMCTFFSLIRRFFQIIDCCKYLSQQSGFSDPKGMVCVLTNQDVKGLDASLRVRHAVGVAQEQGRQTGAEVGQYKLTLSMLRLLSSKAQGRKQFRKPSKPCHVGIHLKALAEYSQMSTHLPGFQSFLRFFASFCFGKISHQQHKG